MRDQSWLPGAAAVVLLAWANPAPATPIVGLFNTGVASDGVPLAEGAPDLHYVLVTNPAGSGPTPFVTVTDGFPIPNFWIPNTATSRWIEPTSGTTNTHPVATYIYQLQFDLTGFLPGTASILGRWATDNMGTISLNGVDTGQTSSTFTAFAPFSITGGFVAGLNTLTFSVVNLPGTIDTNPTGLRVEFTGSDVSPIPEPSTLIMGCTAALLGLGYGWRKRKAKVG